MDIYKNCRFCRHFEDGSCIKKPFTTGTTAYDEVIYLSEEGAIDGAVQEALQSAISGSMNEISALFPRMTKKAREALRSYLTREAEHWAEDVAEATTLALMNNASKDSADVEVADPMSFCCKYFD